MFRDVLLTARGKAMLDSDLRSLRVRMAAGEKMSRIAFAHMQSEIQARPSQAKLPHHWAAYSHRNVRK